METAIRLSPHRDAERQQFVLLDIVNNGISLNEITEKDGRLVKHEQISSYSKLSQYAAFDWSRVSPQLVAFGHVSGSATLLKLKPGIQTSEVIATYQVKQQRRCNSIAFSVQNWLAVALDKTRADLCLNVYDAGSVSLEPVRRLCPAELVSSVRFFAKQPQEVLVGAQRSFIRLYDLRDGFSGASGNIQVATRNVNNIAIDPTDETYFAAGGSTDDPSITIWDKRWLNQGATTIDSSAMLHIKGSSSTSRTSVWSIRFSGHKRGQLAMCSSIGEIKIIDIADNKVPTALRPDYGLNSSQAAQSWSGGSYITSSRTLGQPAQVEAKGVLSSQRAVSFDWLHNDARAPNILVLRANKVINQILNHGPTSMALAATTRFSLASQSEDVIECTSSSSKNDGAHSREQGRNGDLPALSSREELSEVLSASQTYHKRCKDGYLFDCKKNSALVKGSPSLVQLWETIAQLKAMADKDGMVYDSADLAFVGVHGIWSETFGSSAQRRLSPSPTKPLDAIQGLVDKRDFPPFEGERTDYADHRQLCLAVCGWKFTADALEEECQELIERSLHYQAVIQAVLHGAKHLALNLLRSLIRSKTIPNIGLGALLAADELNDDQREMTRWMAADTNDTALKALLAYLETGDWRDVMKTPYLNLGYRLALGLKYLNDTELNGFIQSETARALKNGDPEGVLLTGLTEQSIDLFQKYITRTGDVQTAVLATAFTCPLYVDDPRWDIWKESYFLQMQAWRAFTERTRFVVEHNRMARTREGHCLVEPTVTQAKLHCVHCRSEIRRPTRQESTKALNTPAANAGVVCLKCGRNLPRCSICTLWLGTPDPHRYKPAAKPTESKPGGLAGRMLVFCTKCGHGSHADHAQEWFAQFNVCPSPACGCSCNGHTATDQYSLADLFRRM